MKRIVFDIETDGLMDTVSKVHILACLDVDTNKLEHFLEDDLYKGLELLSNAEELIGHNIIDYDIPALEKVVGWKPNPSTKITDTLVMAKLAHQDIRNEDFRKKPKELQGRYYGSHALRAWGQRLGDPKLEYTGTWEKFNQEMLDYCLQDTRATNTLFQYLMSKQVSEKALDIELKAAATAQRMERYGFTFDVKNAGMLYADLSAQREAIQKELINVFPTRVIERYSEKTGKKLKDQVIEFNPGSRDHIAYWFKEKYSWKPTEFTNGGKPMIDEDILENLEYPEAKQLVGYFMLDKRIGMLSEGTNGWLKLVKADGRVHGRCNTNGAATGRCTHSNPNMAQIPSVRKQYGKECRELFTVPKGYKLVGTDLSGIELRCLAHYMAAYDGGDYAKDITQGDIHKRNQDAAGLPTRDAAKTFIYALLYGAGDAKMGTIVGGGKKEGKVMKEKFLHSLPAFNTLVQKVAKAAERGHIVALDGRKLPVRSGHGAINSLLQGAAAIVAKKWFVLLEENCAKQGWVNGKDFWLSGFIHDEIQMTVREDLAEKASKIAVESANQAGEELGMRCPVDAESKIGNTWYDTH